MFNFAPCCVFLVIAYFGMNMTLFAASKVGSWSEKKHMQWWKEHGAPAQWVSEKGTMFDQLLVLYDREGAAKAMSNKHFVAWMEHLFWLSQFPENWEDDDYFKTKNGQDAFVNIGMNSGLRSIFLRNVSPKDDQLKAIKIFCQIYEAYPKKIVDYGELAVAFSIVFDQPFPEGWPHAFVKRESLVLGDDSPVDRFAFYLKADEEKKLFFKLRKLSAQDLKFVVDTPIRLDELRLLHSVKVKTPQNLEQLFKMIRYDKARLRSGDYIWKHGKYLMKTINVKGGLCVDQAYLTIHTAKAKGIPSMMFMGQGNSGAHAWIGAMKSYGNWGFDFVKFRNEDYPVGQSYDPQTWRRLTDSECKFFSKVSKSKSRISRTHLIWAFLNMGKEGYMKALQMARKVNPQNVLAWDLESVAIAKKSEGEREDFWRRWIQNFNKQEDLRFRGQKRLLAHYQRVGSDEKYDSLLSSVVKSNKSKREDLVVKVAAEKVFVLIEDKQWEEADKVFTKAMKYLRTKAGGALFYNLVQPYIRICLDEGKVEFARTAMKRSVRSFDAKKGSILDHDMKQLAKLVRVR